MSSSVPRGRRTIRAVSAVTVLVLATACGSTPPLDAAAKRSLHEGVAAIRSTSGNLAKAKAAVEKFRADVDRLVSAGALDDADATVLRAQAAQLEARLTEDAPPSAVAPAPSPTAAAKEKKDKPDKGKNDKNKKKGPRADR